MKVAHIMHLRPCDMGDVTPFDLMGAVGLFKALYNASED